MWLRKILGLNKQQKDLDELKKELQNSMVHIVASLQELKQTTSKELCATNNEISIIKNCIVPKPLVNNVNLKLVDVLDHNVTLFSLQEHVPHTTPTNKTKVKNGGSITRNILCSVPELIGSGFLAKSFRFSYPNGLSGQVMSMGNGQGTAILQNGSILAHGTYLSNMALSIPLASYNIGEIIIRQHYLNKIHKNLEELNESVNTLIALVFTDKKAKVEAIKHFYSKCFQELDNVSSNNSYRNAILINIIAKNIEVYELIQFYGNVLQNPPPKSNNDNWQGHENNIKAFLELQDLYLYGKLLAFQYSNLYNRKFTLDLMTEIESLSNLYTEVLSRNKQSIKNAIESNPDKWLDWFLLIKKKKNIERANAKNNMLSLQILQLDIEKRFKEGQNLIKEVLQNVEQPQHFVIENGEVYKLD